MRVDNASKSSHSVVTRAKAVKPRPAFPITHPMQQRTFFMLLKATAHWRALDADAQRCAFDDALMTVFNGFPDLRMRRFNAEAFHGRCSHVLVWELGVDADVSHYTAAVEALHARRFFALPLFEIVEVIAGVEDDEEEALPILSFAL